MHANARTPARTPSCLRWNPAPRLARFAAWAGLFLAVPASAANGLMDLELEQLLALEVTSVAKRGQRLSESAAAIFVITADDIRRSGVTSIPEALRLAPGVEVARLDANKWAIGVRGFNARFANKLLVLVDGRSVYNPLFSGVFWDEQDTLLEDVERIEVIRGPGATLWGANAVNGVINVITRRAQETQGTLVALAAGNQERTTVAARHGGTSADGTAWRVFAKGLARAAGVDAAGNPGSDDWRSVRAGFRADGKLGAMQDFTLHGEVFGNVAGERMTTVTLLPPFARTAAGDTHSSGFHFAGRLKTRHDDGESTLQAYVDHGRLVGFIGRDVRTTWDLEYGRHQRLGAQTLSWGLGLRIIHDATAAGVATMVPDARSDRLASGYLQDEIALGRDFVLTVGSKFEHNGYTGWEVQPSLRGLWHASRDQTLWASVSRAVRTPARGDTQVRLDYEAQPGPLPGLPLLLQVQGNPQLEPERVLAWEAGWRIGAAPGWALDLALFRNDYSRLRSGELLPARAPTPATPYFLVPIVSGNLLDGRIQGAEAVLEARPRQDWRLQGSLGVLDMKLRVREGSSDTLSVPLLEGSSPRHQAMLRSEWSVGPQADVDFWVRHVARLRALDVPDQTSLNLRLAWRPARGVEWSLVGRNLLDRAQPEFRPDFFNTQATELPRAWHVALKLSL